MSKLLIVLSVCVLSSNALASRDQGYRYQNGQCVNGQGQTGLNPNYMGQCGDLHGKVLADRDLSFINLSGADLRGANFLFTSLRAANLSGADLRETNLRHVDLKFSNLKGADLSGVNLHWTELSGAVYSGSTRLPVSDEDASLLGMIKEQ
jgi:uncharacterized protein YjbI with pentapeptide repeats